MPSFNTAQGSDFQAALAEVEQEVAGASSLEKAGQRCCEVLYRAFEESIVLTRFFATIPYCELPLRQRTFVDALAREKEIRPLLLPQTPVLSLLGTRGARREWNDRRLSKGHVGIPLVSLGFVDSIPMISRLLRELDSSLHWLGGDGQFVQKVLGGGSSGLFYVDDARTGVDAQRRWVIAGRDFVRDHEIKTVFGVGRNLGDGALLVQVFFLRESVSRARTIKLLPLATSLGNAAAARMSAGRIYSAEPLAGSGS